MTTQRVTQNARWFLIGAGLLAVAFLVHSPYMAFALYTFLLLLAVSNVSSRLWLTGLETTRAMSTTMVQQGDTVDVEVTVRNRRGWPIPWIFFEDLGPADFPRNGERARLAVLMPGRSVTLKYSLICPRRGYHRIGPLLMETGDLFGLQKRFRSGEQQDYLTVLPTVAYIDTFNIAARRPQGPVRISNRVYEDPTRISGVREYVPGDPLNRIHWKVSARHGDLFVKQTEHSSVLGATIILDLHEDSYVPERRDSRMELAITTAASIAYLLQMSGEQIGLVTNAADAAEVAQYEAPAQEALARVDAEAELAEDIETTRISPLTVPTQRGAAQAAQIAENLARVLPGKGLDAAQLILSQFPSWPRDAALIPIVPEVNDALALTLAQMKQSGFAVSVILIDNNKGYPEAAALLAGHDINAIHIAHERDLHEISPLAIGR